MAELNRLKEEASGLQNAKRKLTWICRLPLSSTTLDWIYSAAHTKIMQTISVLEYWAMSLDSYVEKAVKVVEQFN